MKRLRGKFACVLLAACLALSCVPAAALAQGSDVAGGGADLGQDASFVGGSAYTDVNLWVTDGFSIQMTPDFAAGMGEIERNQMTLQVVAASYVGTVAYEWTRVELDAYGQAATEPEAVPGADGSGTYLLYEHVGSLRTGATYEYRVTATDGAGSVAQASCVLVVSDEYITTWLPDQSSAPKVYGLSIHRSARLVQTEHPSGSQLHEQLRSLAGSGLVLADEAYQLDMEVVTSFSPAAAVAAFAASEGDSLDADGIDGAGGASGELYDQYLLPFVGTLDVYLPVDRADVSSVSVVALEESGAQRTYRDLPVLEDGTVKIAVSSLGAFAVAYALSDLEPEELATVEATAGEGGSIDPAGTATYAVGSKAVYTVYPDDGYVADALTVDGQPAELSGNTYTFDGLSAGGHAIHATFAKVSATDPDTGEELAYSVAAKVQGGNGFVKLDGQGPAELVELDGVAAGSPVQVQFVPGVGYHVDRVTVQVGNRPSQEVSVTGDVYRLSAVEDDTVITVSYAEGAGAPVLTHTVTAEVVEGNGAVGPAELEVVHGQRAVVTVAPDRGWRVLSVTANGADAKGMLVDGSLVLQSVLADTAVQVAFADHYQVTATAGEGGSVSPQEQQVAVGGTAEFSVQPWSGYEFDSAVLTGSDGASFDVTAQVVDGVLTWANVHDDLQLHVEFRVADSSGGDGDQDTLFKVTIGSTSGGSLSPSGELSVTEGTSLDVAVVPDEGYVLESLTLNGTDVTAQVVDGVFVVADIACDTVLFAVFAPVQQLFKIEAAVAGGGGSLSPSGDVYVAAGASCTFRFFPDAGYRVSFVTVDGQVLPYTASSYTFDNVYGPHSIQVGFELAAAAGGSAGGAFAQTGDAAHVKALAVLGVAVVAAAVLAVAARRRRLKGE